MSSKVFIVVPTFRETEKVGSLLQSVRHLHHRPLELVVVNADPGDATSQLLAREAKHGDLIIHEEPGIPEQFWSGTVNRGLRRVARRSRSGDWVLLMNVDVIFHNDIVGALLHAALRRSPCQIGAVAHARGNVISSGVQVKSWMLTLNRHPLAGLREGHIPKGVCIPVDFLPTRCLLFPADALKNVGLVQERRLPHYGADYEFSLRLARHGYAAFLLGDARVESDAANTGNDVFQRQGSFRERLRKLNSIKSPYNPRYRINYVLLTYPSYAVPTALLGYLARTLLEVFLGGDVLKRIFRGPEWGFSN